MSRFQHFAKRRAWLVLGLFMLACDPWFAYSPFEAQLEEAYHGTHQKNLDRIEALDMQDSRTFNIALLSDPHYHFRKLEDAIAHINAQGDYTFAVVTGDLTENGLMREFIFFHDTMSRLKIPYLTTIGNHDYLANGEMVYAQMFGAGNYTYTVNNVKFVFFDNVTLESEMDPDMNWLSAALDDGHVYDHVIPFSHIPPYDTQMRNHRRQFHELLLINNISLSLHGHRHDFSIEDVYGDGVRYVTISSPQKRTYTRLTVSPTGLEVQKIEY